MRWLAAWALFWLGDAVSRIANALPDSWPRAQDWLGDACQRLMRWSDRVQGSGPGPWKDAR